MYNNVWLKYLPVIRIVLKRAVNSEQVLPLNIPDFERSGLKRKSGYKFLIKFMNGRLEDVIIDSPLASSLATVLLEDSATRAILAAHNYQVGLNPKFELTITLIAATEPIILP